MTAKKALGDVFRVLSTPVPAALERFGANRHDRRAKAARAIRETAGLHDFD